MNINGILEELNIEVLRLIAINDKRSNKDTDVLATLKKIETSINSLKKKLPEIDNQLGLFEKIKLKSELKEVLNIMINDRFNIQFKIFEADLKLTKICSKYKVNVERKKTDSRIDNKDGNNQDEEVDPALIDRIAKAYDAAKRNRAESGIKKDEPVMILDTQEIRDAAKRSRSIEAAILKKKEAEREAKERAARISAAIDKKRAEERKRSIASQEDARYESVMARKIKDLMAHLDDENETRDKVFVRYELQNDTYYLNGEPVIVKPERLISIEEKEKYIKSKLRNQSEYSFLVDKYILEEENALRYCDPYIVGILLSKDIRLARDYIKQMAGTSLKKVSDYDFDVTYDVRGLDSKQGKELSFRERRSIRKTAKNSKSVAKVLEDKKRLPWYAIIPVIGALAIGGIAEITASLNGGNQNNDKEVSSGNSYTDTVEPGTSTKENTHTEETSAYISGEVETETSYTTTVMETTMPVETTTITTTNQDTVITTTKQQEKDEKDKEQEDSEIKVVDNESENTIINIGDKINVQDGLRYTANCLGGGNSNRIGAVSWRPATEYNIDRVAFVHKGRILYIMNAGDKDIVGTLDEVANKYGIEKNDITTSVLLSLVPGIADTGWANISIDEMQSNISKTVEEKANSISHINMDFDR